MNAHVEFAKKLFVSLYNRVSPGEGANSLCRLKKSAVTMTVGFMNKKDIMIPGIEDYRILRKQARELLDHDQIADSICIAENLEEEQKIFLLMCYLTQIRVRPNVKGLNQQNLAQAMVYIVKRRNKARTWIQGNSGSGFDRENY